MLAVETFLLQLQELPRHHCKHNISLADPATAKFDCLVIWHDCQYRSRKRQMEIKAALAEARRNQEAQFARDWQDRLKQLKAEEVMTQLLYWL